MQRTIFTVIAKLKDPATRPVHQVFVVTIIDPEGKRSTYHQVRWMPPGHRTAIIVGNHNSELSASIRRKLIESYVRTYPNVRTWEELEIVMGYAPVLSA